ncbi:unnamed protein product [Rotaria sp. Silwood1]|nr:unnamed protein product [Rotaria sp. Silwood1]CAF1418620.1 unnamed protein product [Rotaria sp. Silwood1]
MASISSSGTDLISITVQISSKGSDATVDLNNIPSSMTIGELKTKLNVRPNSRFGRLNQFENWDNQRPLSDYFVKNGESFDCVIQSVIEDEQRSSDDYDEWLLANQRSVLNKINDGSIEDDKLNKMEKIVVNETLNNTVIDGFEVYDQDNNRPVSSKVQRHQIPILFIIKNFLRT